MVIESCESNTRLRVVAIDPVCQRSLDEQRQRLAEEAEMKKKCYACRWTVRRLSNLPKMAATISQNPCGYYCKDEEESSDRANYRIDKESPDRWYGPFAHWSYSIDSLEYHNGVIGSGRQVLLRNDGVSVPYPDTEPHTETDPTYKVSRVSSNAWSK